MRHFPAGSWFKSTMACLACVGFLLLPCLVDAERGVEIKSKEDLSHKSGKLGAYKALVIGINNYQDKKIPALKTAVNDAREFANLLQTRYDFKVDLLLDRQATRKEIIDKLRDLAANSSANESVLIYYAGHGEIDRVLNDGWWVPADAKGGDSSTYLDNTVVQRVMKGMKARHVLLLSDSCYSGTLFGEERSLPPLIDDKFYLNLYNEKSRWGMTSGNKTPVSDSGSEGHSIFAYQLIRALTKNEKPYITTQEIYSQIAPIIANNSEQQPLCSPVRDTGDEGGGFVFVSSRASSIVPPRRDPDELAEQMAALERERQELERERQELERQKALDAEREQLAMGKRPLLSTADETGRDGRFIAYNNGTVLDTKTNLMWAARDNGNSISWANAKSYCENYQGGGYTDWRMPTQDELVGLYDAGKSRKPACGIFIHRIHVATELIDITCFAPWASETRGSEAALFYFDFGWRDWSRPFLDLGTRALPVRSGK
ncbi:MAG TPA: caspase family protein [Syntrophales bacterium]|nr:caspase family protein [Syntrophales bacterium]